MNEFTLYFCAISEVIEKRSNIYLPLKCWRILYIVINLLETVPYTIFVLIIFHQVKAIFHISPIESDISSNQMLMKEFEQPASNRVVFEQ